MIYLQAGLYAEGPTDYDFLVPLLERLLDDLLARHYPGQSTKLPTPLALDAASDAGARRDGRIADVIQRFAPLNHLPLVNLHGREVGRAFAAHQSRSTGGPEWSQAIVLAPGTGFTDVSFTR